VWLAELNEYRIKLGIHHFMSNLKVQKNQPWATTVRPTWMHPNTKHLLKEEIKIRDFIPTVKNVKLVHVNFVNKKYFVTIYKHDVIPICFELLFCFLI
jgi:hypothetical protein